VTPVIAPPQRTGPVARCPEDGRPLSGGPVLWWCTCGAEVRAADISREVSR
jgi:hypothetical protein